MRRNSLASSSDTSFLPQPSLFSGRPFTGISSFGVRVVLSFCSSTILAFPLTFAGCVGRSRGANTRPLWVTPLSPVILVTLADNELMSVASSFLSLRGVYLHGTAWLFWYGQGTGLAAEGYQGFCETASLVKYITNGLGLPKVLSSTDCIHICCSSLPSSPTSSRPSSIIRCNNSSTAKHDSMLCSSPGCNKQESSSCPLWGITPPFCRASKINFLGVATSFKGLDLRGLSDSMALTAPPP